MWGGKCWVGNNNIDNEIDNVLKCLYFMKSDSNSYHNSVYGNKKKIYNEKSNNFFILQLKSLASQTQSLAVSPILEIILLMIITMMTTMVLIIIWQRLQTVILPECLYIAKCLNSFYKKTIVKRKIHGPIIEEGIYNSEMKKKTYGNRGKIDHTLRKIILNFQRYFFRMVNSRLTKQIFCCP